VLMDLELNLVSIPDETALGAVDRWLSSLARQETAIHGGRRLWLTHVPETAVRPFLEARPFDILVAPVYLGASAQEAYRMSLGAFPTRRVICRANDDSKTSLEILLVLATELMQRWRAYLCIDAALGRRLVSLPEHDDEFDGRCLSRFAGTVYEVAQELGEDELEMRWLVDVCWLRAFRAWRERRCPSSHDMGEPCFARFSSLDYQ